MEDKRTRGRQKNKIKRLLLRILTCKDSKRCMLPLSTSGRTFFQVEVSSRTFCLVEASTRTCAPLLASQKEPAAPLILIMMLPLVFGSTSLSPINNPKRRLLVILIKTRHHLTSFISTCTVSTISTCT